MSKTQNHCIDCGDKISPRATRCESCAAKARWARGDFNNEEYRHKLTQAMQVRWERGDFDNMHTEECLRKMSEATEAAWERGDFDGEETRRKMSEATKAAHARGDFDGEETRRKMSEAMKVAHARGDFDGHSEAMKAAWARGVYADRFTEETRRKLSEATEAQWARGCFDDVFKSPTSIELEIAAALDIMGIEHQPQYRPEGYSRIYDEFIPPNTLIEVQGDYWHSEEHFPGIQKRDAEKAAWATENGYELIVTWEYEIKEHGAQSIIAQKLECAASATPSSCL